MDTKSSLSIIERIQEEELEGRYLTVCKILMDDIESDKKAGWEGDVAVQSTILAILSDLRAHAKQLEQKLKELERTQ